MSRDLYVELDAIGFPSGVVQRLTFEEQVTNRNISRLREMVDKWLYLTVPVVMTVISEQLMSFSLDQKGAPHLRWSQLSVRWWMDQDIMCMRIAQSRSTIASVTPCLLTSMATISYASNTTIVGKSADLELLVLRTNWSVTSRKVSLQLGSDFLVAMKAMSHRTMLDEETTRTFSNARCCISWVKN